MEQWLIEGKLTQKEILTLCCDMLAAGIETVSLLIDGVPFDDWSWLMIRLWIDGVALVALDCLVN